MNTQGTSTDRTRALLAGVIIDLADFLLRGPLGLYLGFPVGCILGIFLGLYIGLSWVKSSVLGIFAGIYCTIPGTFFLPLGTVAALLRGFGGTGNSGDGSAAASTNMNGKRGTGNGKRL
jgi:hypothetical protein